jgi:hypothetical protein
VNESRQLDQISERLGELSAYIHENRHSSNNLALKFDALGIRITKDIASMEARLEAKLIILEERVRQLELDDAKVYGGKNVVDWIFQSPLLAWIAAAAVVVYTRVTASGQTPH